MSTESRREANRFLSEIEELTLGGMQIWCSGHVSLYVFANRKGILNTESAVMCMFRLPCCRQSSKLGSYRRISWSVRWWRNIKTSCPTVTSWCTSTTSCTKASPATIRYNWFCMHLLNLLGFKLPVLTFCISVWRIMDYNFT